VESPSVGSNNVFEIRSRVAFNVSVGSHCTVGAGCVVLPSPFSVSRQDDTAAATSAAQESENVAGHVDRHKEIAIETLQDYTQVFGAECRRRTWSGEGSAQAKSLHSKHLDYLRETLPKYNKLKMFT
jgi:dynactin-6